MNSFKTLKYIHCLSPCCCDFTLLEAHKLWFINVSIALTCFTSVALKNLEGYRGSDPSMRILRAAAALSSMHLHLCNLHKRIHAKRNLRQDFAGIVSACRATPICLYISWLQTPLASDKPEKITQSEDSSLKVLCLNNQRLLQRGRFA